MLCPKCGYFMDAFDRVCPRCKGEGVSPPPAQQNPPPDPVQQDTSPTGPLPRSQAQSVGPLVWFSFFASIIFIPMIFHAVYNALTYEPPRSFPNSFPNPSPNHSPRTPLGVLDQIVSPPIVTKAEYDQLRAGMSYDQVKSIIGHPGEHIAHQELAGFVDDGYQWINGNGSNALCQFQNGKLVIMAQAGLQ